MADRADSADRAERADTAGTVHIARVYDAEARARPRAFLVDRLWPRGLRRDDLGPDAWAKDAAPSAELRRWFGHEPRQWEEFRERYFAELDANPDAWARLLPTDGDVTLLYAARDTERNNAVVLREYLLAHLQRRS